ncbi:MAG: hypothetical protein ABJF88_04090 [Rhodothermales bacterium]
MLRLLLGLVLLAPTAASAQIMSAVTGLFDSVNSIAFSVSGGQIVGDTELDADCLGGGVCAMGIEVLLDLPSPEGIVLELGLGTRFLRGFGATEPTLDLRGSVRTLPEVSVYVTRPEVMGRRVVQPYAGLNFGFAQLWNMRGYDAEGTQYEVDSEAFEVGATVGAFLDVAVLSGLFVEATYRHRRFDSLDWSIPGAPVLPPGWPRELNVSTALVTVGWQFRLTE